MKTIKPWSTTSIGSVPYDNTDEAINLMAENVMIPANPQMVEISYWEDMLWSALEGIPSLEIDDKNKSIKATTKNIEENLTVFYEKFLNGDYQFLNSYEKYGLGFKAMLAKAKADKNFGSEFLKSQVIGPITFSQTIVVDGAKKILDEQEIFEAVVKALGAKGAYQAKQIRQTGREPIIFFDEPGLSGYGSAFSSLKPETVIDALSECVEIVKSAVPAIIGCHVCGNTDWGLMTKTGVDIINFDAYDYLLPFTLYPKEIQNFLQNGGYIAWGIVPTQNYKPEITPDILAQKVKEACEILTKNKVDYQLLKDRSLITTSCGLGSLLPENAKAITKLLPKVRESIISIL